MEADNHSNSDGPAAKRQKLSSDQSLMHLFVDYVAAQDTDAHTQEEIWECVEILKGNKSNESSNVNSFHQVVQKKLNYLLPILLACNDDVNFVGIRDQTILHCFVMHYTYKCSTKEDARSKDREIVESLLKKGASVDTVDMTKNTPVHYAAFNHRTDLVRLMLERFTNLNAANGCGYTVLHGLVYHYNEEADDVGIELVRALVSKGADFRKPTDKSQSSPMDVATVYILIKILGAFKINEADHDRLLLRVSKSLDSRLPRFDELQCLDRVVNLSKSVHSRSEKGGLTPLHFASKAGIKEVVEMFVNAGADVDAVSNEGVTPLHLAVLNGNLDVAEYLIERGANLHARDTVFDFGLIHMAIVGCRRKVLELLVEHGLDVNDQSRDGITPLHLATMAANDRAMKRLLEHGASVHPRTRKKQLTLLHLLFHEESNVLKRISDKHHNSIRQEFWKSNNPLVVRREESINLLLQIGENVNARDSQLKTPLYYALTKCQSITSNPERIPRALLHYGARVDVHDVNSMSPMMNYNGFQSDCGAMELLRYGADINDINYITSVLSAVETHLHRYARLLVEIDLPVKPTLKNTLRTIDREMANHRPIYNNYNNEFRPPLNTRNVIGRAFENRDKFDENLNVEVAKLNTHYLPDGKTTVYDFLHMSSKDRLKFVEYLLSLDLESEYPLYHVVIENRCRRAVNEKSILSLASSTLEQIIQLVIPDVCMENIMKYISLTEMTTFIDIVENFIL